MGTRGYGDWKERGNVTYVYDGAGNARQILTTSEGDIQGGHTIELDADQRVRKVAYRAGGALNVSYDLAGNPKSVSSTSGDSAAYEYDSANRLRKVTLNGREILNYDYQRNEQDIRTQTDHKTMRTLLPGRRASIIFGDSFEILHTRTQGTPLGPVVFDEELVAFRLVTPMAVILDDAATYEGLSRMRLINFKRGDHNAKDKFEQPSNVLFLPAEYVSMNCCVPCPPLFPQLYGTCSWPEGADAPLCYCVPEPPPPTTGICSASLVDQTAIAKAFAWPLQQPFERGSTIVCPQNDTTATGYDTSSWSTTQDPCQTSILLPTTGWVGAVHSHPHFATASEYRAGIGCRGDKSFLNASQLSVVNATNENFGPGDIAGFRNRESPLYMRTPAASVVVKKLLGSSGGAYTISNIYP